MRQDETGTGRTACAVLAAVGLTLVLAVYARGAALVLGGVLAGPLPAVRTARQLVREPPAAAQPAPERNMNPPDMPEADADKPEETAVEPTPAARDYLVPLLDESARPEGAGVVLEKTFSHGIGGQYIPCGTGSIRNNTKVSNEEAAAAAAGPLPFSIERWSDAPQVLIMHTHATEDYRMSEGLWIAPGDTARSTDSSRNMCAVGRVITDTLNAAGIRTLHDETLNDYPSYTGSYANSRAVVQRYLEQYPSIRVVLDVHRDAIENDSGARTAPVCTIGGRQSAQVMIICGCDNGTTVTLPEWRQNLRFAAAWESAMEGLYPGLTRPVLFSYRFYNQDLTTGSLLIEVGGHGNNLNEALYAGELAAKGLVLALTGETL